MNWSLKQGDAFGLLRDLEDASIDALITDMPYSSGGQFKGDRSSSARTKYQRSNVEAENEAIDFTGDNRDQRGFLAWATLWLTEAFRVLKTGAPVALFTDWRQLPIMTDAIQAGGFIWRGIVPWNKPNPRPRKGALAQGSEFVVWGTKGACASEGACHGLKPWLYAPPHYTKRVHLTEKPVELLRELVKLCPPGGVVLDPFAGSGATGVAALLEGRRFLGVELSHEYHAIAKARLEETAAELERAEARAALRPEATCPQ